MIHCPTCRQQELEGELFCSNCGARLWQLPEEDKPTLAFTSINKLRDTAQVLPAEPTTADLCLGQIALLLPGQVIILEGKSQYVIGREGLEKDPPDVNLSAYGAREKGVSRKHALLRVDRRQLLLMDLGSSNGTWLNGTPLTANEPVRLESGDEIRLGRLLLRIRFNL
ncbi:MAG: FHA domain-containing protein [Anaerolineales bacterium]|nr:FHA domain-containing protein [Anaerolineales bacterium]